MNEKPIRVLVVDADPGGGQALLEALDQGDEFELLGVARNRQTAIQQAETSQTWW